MNRHRQSYVAAFSLIELIVVVGIVLLLAFVLVPSIANVRKKSQRIDCVDNLKQTALAFRLWAGDSMEKFPMMETAARGGTLEVSNDVWRTFLVMSNGLSVPGVLVCPADSRRTAKSWATLANSNVSYFIGLDADEAWPAMLLSGDRNLTNARPLVGRIMTVASNDVVGWTDALHKGCGNIALSDGSVQQFTQTRLREAVSMALHTNATLRLAMPE